MADVVGRIVRAFRSLDYGQWNTGNHASSVRRALDTPRLLMNMMHTDDGQLWMPPAPDTFVTGVAGTGNLHLIRQTFDPVGTLIVQKGTTVSLYEVSNATLPYTTADATFVLDDDEKIWTLVYDGALFFGNSTQTVKVTGSYTVTDITDPGIPDGYHSVNYRNRRFVLERVFGTAGGVNNRLHYSDIGDAETFGGTAFIDIEAYFEGDSWEGALGSPIALEPYGDFLALFTSQGVVRFTGTDPLTNFTLRPTHSETGAWFRDSVSTLSPGIIFFGGTPRAEWGYYLWNGSGSNLLSEGLNGYLRAWGESSQTFDENLSDSVTWRNRYISSLNVGNIDPTIFVYDWMRKVWSTFNGWTQPTVGLARRGTDRLCVAEADSDIVYYTKSPMFRATATTPAQFTVGYEDEDQPSGLVRFIKVRLTVNALATGGTGIELKMVGSVVPLGSTATTIKTITEDGQWTLEFPLRMRGSAVELEFTITPSAADQEIVVENLELVQSRKNLKVTRRFGGFGSTTFSEETDQGGALTIAAIADQSGTEGDVYA